MSDCIFCKIVSGEFGSATIYENDGITIAYKPMDLTDEQIEDMRKKLEMSL